MAHEEVPPWSFVTANLACPMGQSNDSWLATVLTRRRRRRRGRFHGPLPPGRPPARNNQPHQDPITPLRPWSDDFPAKPEPTPNGWPPPTPDGRACPRCPGWGEPYPGVPGSFVC